MYILCLSVCFFKFNNQFRKSTHHSSYEPREGFIMVKDEKCFPENFSTFIIYENAQKH